MNYKEAFAIDSKTFENRKEDKSSEKHKFTLNNFDYYQPKLVDDFYLKYFIKELLFETDIFELKDFLEYHYDYCENPEKYYKILDFKVIPKIEEIIDNAELSIGGREYYDEKHLEDGFVETEGVIKNYDYDYRMMNHRAAWDKLQNDFKKRIEIIKVFVKNYKGDDVVKPLKWIAGPSQLAIVVRELIDKGYMQADETRGEINNAQLARELFKVFAIEECVSSKSIEIYLSPVNMRNIKAKKKFEDCGFCIPDAKFT